MIMPDIEKRLRSVRTLRARHHRVPGRRRHGRGDSVSAWASCSIRPMPKQPLPVIFTGPPSAAEYFGQIDRFIGATLGDAARSRYKIIIGDPPQAAREAS